MLTRGENYLLLLLLLIDMLN